MTIRVAGGKAKWSSFCTTARPTTLREQKTKRQGRKKRAQQARPPALAIWQKSRARDIIKGRRQDRDTKNKGFKAHTNSAEESMTTTSAIQNTTQRREGGTSQTPRGAQASNLSIGATSITTAVAYVQSVIPQRRTGASSAWQKQGSRTAMKPRRDAGALGLSHERSGCASRTPRLSCNQYSNVMHPGRRRARLTSRTPPPPTQHLGNANTTPTIRVATQLGKPPSRPQHGGYCCGGGCAGGAPGCPCWPSGRREL